MTEQSRPANQPAALQPGTPAPDFNLPSTPDQKVALHEFRGQPVVLVFYPADWSPVCGSELALFNEVLPEFRQYHAEVMGISVDGPWSHLEYAKQNHIHFPLLSDFEPKGQVARTYGVYQQDAGEADRALYLIGPEGKVLWSYVSPTGVNPGVDGVLQALEDMQKEKAK